MPVIAPIGVDKLGQTYNCNADTAAGAIAGALKAHRLLLLTDVAGVLNKEKELLQQIDSLKVGGGVGERAKRWIPAIGSRSYAPFVSRTGHLVARALD